MPTYVADEYSLIWDNENKKWTVIFLPMSIEVCRGCEQRLHPTTTDLWNCITDIDSDGNYVYTKLNIGFRHDTIKSSKASPWDMRVFGLDFFEHRHISSVIWFKCPETSTIHHSGAKRCGADDTMGKRYCHSCRQCYSANNFKFQHLASEFHKSNACCSLHQNEAQLNEISLDEFMRCVADVLL